MNMQMVRLGGVAQWAPAPYSPRLAQWAVPVAAVPAPADAKVSLIDIDSPLTSFLTAAIASSATGILGHSFGKVHSRWSTVFWSLSALTGFKALIDLSRLK